MLQAATQAVESTQIKDRVETFWRVFDRRCSIRSQMKCVGVDYVMWCHRCAALSLVSALEVEADQPLLSKKITYMGFNSS